MSIETDSLQAMSMTAADIARANGWGPGTRLRSGSGHGCSGDDKSIEITERLVLAKCKHGEGPWALNHRRWEREP